MTNPEQNAELSPDGATKTEQSCLCGCPARDHPHSALGYSRRGCGKLGPDGRPHCYGYVSPEDEIDA